jgi:hypothetical protein
MKTKMMMNNHLIYNHRQQHRLFNVLQKVFKHVRVSFQNRELFILVCFLFSWLAAARRRNNVTTNSGASPTVVHRIRMFLVSFCGLSSNFSCFNALF